MVSLFDHRLISPILVGRHRELATLQQFIDLAPQVRGRAILIGGEAGVGKSRLLAEGERYAVERGFLPLRIRCFQSDTAFPYAPLLEPLRNSLPSDLDSTDSHEFRTVVTELIHLLPEVAPFPSHPLPERPEFLQMRPEQRKYRLFVAMVEFFRMLSTDTPLIFLVEDIHWCDEGTLEFLHTLMRHALAHPHIFLVTYRSEEVAPELARWMALLDRDHLSHLLRLDRLSSEEVDAQICAILALEHPPHRHLVETLYALTDGNPFFVEELIKSLILSGSIDSKQGSWSEQGFHTIDIPHSVQATVQQRLAHISDDARQVVQLAAVMGRHFDFSVLQQLTAFDDLGLIKLIKELISAQLIIEESADRFIFRHELTRQAIYNTLLARERRLLHGKIALMLEGVYATKLDRGAADLAYHFYEAAAWEKALQYSMEAAEHAQSLYALRPALEHSTRAIEAARHLELPPQLALHRARALLYEMVGDLKSALSELEFVLREAEMGGDEATEWQALLDLGTFKVGQNYAQAGHYFQRAYTLAQRIASPPALAQSLNRLGNWYVNIESPQEAYRCHRQALSIFRQLQDQSGIGETLDFLGMAHYLGGDLIQGSGYYQQAVELFQALDQRQGLISILATLTMRAPTFQTDTMVPAVETLAQAVYDAERGLKMAREIGHRSGEVYTLVMMGICVGSQGEYQRAFDHLQQGLKLAQEIEHRQWMTSARIALGALYAEVMAFPQAVAALQEAIEEAKAIQSQHWLRHAVAFLALTYLQVGELAQAEQLLQAHLDRAATIQTIGQRLMWRATAELALARGEGALALEAVERLMTSAANATPGRVISRLAKLRGDALSILGEAERAGAEMAQVQEVAIAQGARPLLWRVLAAHSRLCASQSRMDEAMRYSSDARQVIDELARQLPQSLRYQFYQNALSTLMPEHRTLTQMGDPPEATTAAHAKLTPREYEVVLLLAAGRSNRQIAEELVVSERTAETHVRNILAKLELTSRAQVALWAMDQGLIKPHQKSETE